MRTDDLETLIKVVEYGSLSQAAQALHLTQSAVSQRLKNLESHFGQALITRGSPIRLTTKGEQVIHCGRQILALEQQMHAAPVGENNTLRVYCTPVFGFSRMPALMHQFNQQHGERASVSVFQGLPEAGVSGVNQQDLDLAILEHYHPLPQNQGERRCLPPEHVLFVAKAGLEIPSDLAQLQSHRLYTARPGCSSRELLEANLKSQGSSMEAFPAVMEFDDINLVLNTICEGQGIAFIAHSLVQPLLQSGEAIGFEIPEFNHYLRRSLLTQLEESELASQFIRHVDESLEARPALHCA